MKHWWVNTILAGIVAISFGIFKEVSAQNTVFCTNCGTEWTQLMDKALLVKQLAQQAQQLQSQISQYQNMVQNTAGVPQQLWGNTMGDLQRLGSLLQQSKAVAYSAANLDTQFAQQYPGYQKYANSLMNNTTWQNQYTQWSNTARDNALYGLKAAGAQNADMQSENALMSQLQTMSQSSTGRMQALQIANMIASENIGQIQKLRQLLMTQLQMQANYYQLQQDKEDAAQAAHEQFFKSANFDSRNGQGF